MAIWLFNTHEYGDNYAVIDEFTAEEPSKEEMNSIAQKIMSENDCDCVFIGKGKKITADDVVPDYIGDDILEEIADHAYDNICDNDDLISTTAEQRKQFNDLLYEVIVSWMDEHKVITGYYTVDETIRFDREGL